MNEFNRSVKQNKKTILAITVMAIVALILCVATSITVGVSKAEATPESLQLKLDQTSTAYFDALSAQQEAQSKVNEAQATIEKCEREIPYAQGKIRELAKFSYMNKGFGEVLEVITGANSIQSLVDNIQYVNIIHEKNAEVVQNCKNLKAQVEAEKASLDENLAEATAQANVAANAYQEAQAAIAEAQRNPQPTPGGGGGGYNPGHTDSDVANRALGEIGKPYVWGAVGPGGYDCSGLVSYAISGAHTRIGTTTTFMGWPQLDSPVVGCVCTNDHHCGIYVGNGSMCHAPYEGKCVECISLSYFSMIYVQRG